MVQALYGTPALQLSLIAGAEVPITPWPGSPPAVPGLMEFFVKHSVSEIGISKKAWRSHSP